MKRKENSNLAFHFVDYFYILFGFDCHVGSFVCNWTMWLFYFDNFRNIFKFAIIHINGFTIFFSTINLHKNRLENLVLKEGCRLFQFSFFKDNRQDKSNCSLACLFWKSTVVIKTLQTICMLCYDFRLLWPTKNTLKIHITQLDFLSRTGMD